MNQFDFILRLNADEIVRATEAISPSTPILPPKPTPKGYRHPIGFDPVTDFVRRAQVLHGDSIALFHDVHGGNVIAGVFNPDLVSQPRRWRPSLDVAFAPVEGVDASKVVLDRKAIVVGLCRLGVGLIDSVEENWNQ